MLEAVSNLLQSLRPPSLKEVYFRSLAWNRKTLLWYADKLVNPNSTIETVQRLKQIDELRKKGNSLTFISNHLTYADSHIIEALLIRFGFKALAGHLIHIAGQKTYQLSRRLLTRSLNTVRVYQPKAAIDPAMKRKMNSRALKWAAHMKRRGYSLLVYPEGTRSRRQKRFNLHGANPRTTLYFRDSIVVPFALMGSEKIMPVGRILPRKATVHLCVGEPIRHSEVEQKIAAQHSAKDEKKIREGVMTHYMRQINSLLDPEYQHTGDIEQNQS